MDFDSENVAVTSEVMALATVCGQTFMGEDKSGAVVFAYSRNNTDLSNPRPGEKPCGFTIFNGQIGLATDVATQNMVSKILTSGQIFDINGRANPNLINLINSQASNHEIVDSLSKTNGRDYKVTHSVDSVRNLSAELVNCLAGSHDWVMNFAERARILRDMSSQSSNVILEQTVHVLGELMNLARDVNKKNTLQNIHEETQTR